MKSRFCSTASAVPRYQSRPPATDVRLQQRHAAVAAVQVPGTADADVIHQRARGVLGQHRHVGEPGVDGVREREVDDPVLAAERDARLGAHLGQHRQPLALAPGQDQGQDRCRHASDSPMRRAPRRSLAVSGDVAAPAWRRSAPARRPSTGRRPGTGCRGRPAAACRRSRRSTPRRWSAPGCTGCSRCRGSRPRSPGPPDGSASCSGLGEDHLTADGRAEAAVAEHRRDLQVVARVLLELGRIARSIRSGR